MVKIKLFDRWFRKKILQDDLEKGLKTIIGYFYDGSVNPQYYGNGFYIGMTQQYNDILNEQEFKIIIRKFGKIDCQE